MTVAAALAMGLAGASKFLAADMWDANFTQWGYSVGFKSLIGVLEVAGAILVLVPRYATYAAALVCAIMLGAVYTIFANDSDLGYAASVGNLVLFAIIAYARRGDRWTPAG